MSATRKLSSAAWLATTLIGMLIMMAPLLWALSSSLKPVGDLFSFPPRWIPETFDFRAYVDVWHVTQLGQWLLNTAFLALCAAAGNMISCSLVGYGFAQFRFPGRDALFVIVLATLMLPQIITILPLYLGFKQFGLLNTYWPLILPHWLAAGGESALYIFIFRQFFLTIPSDIPESARIEGANEFQIFHMIVAPMAKPAFATAGVLSIVFVWGDFLQPMIFLNDSKMYPISVGLQAFKDNMGSTQLMTYLLAATLIALVPVLLVFLFAQRYFIDGVATQGLK